MVIVKELRDLHVRHYDHDIHDDHDPDDDHELDEFHLSAATGARSCSPRSSCRWLRLARPGESRLLGRGMCQISYHIFILYHIIKLYLIWFDHHQDMSSRPGKNPLLYIPYVPYTICSIYHMCHIPYVPYTICTMYHMYHLQYVPYTIWTIYHTYTIWCTIFMPTCLVPMAIDVGIYCKICELIFHDVQSVLHNESKFGMVVDNALL